MPYPALRPNENAHAFGVIETDPSNRIHLFSTRALLKALHEDAADEASSHDFGRDILPRMVSEQQAIYACDFQTNKIPGDRPIYRSTGATWAPPTRTGRPIWT
jgi:ADP-glucose pyrophosphorylase